MYNGRFLGSILGTSVAILWTTITIILWVCIFINWNNIFINALFGVFDIVWVATGISFEDRLKTEGGST